MAFTHDNSIPPFPATTLSSSYFRWLQERDWEDAERRYFCDERKALTEGIFSPPPVFRDNSKPHLVHIGRWVLNPFPENATLNVGWAEVHLMRGPFRTAWVILGRPGNGEFQSLDAWAMMISATFTLYHADCLRVVPAYMPLSTLVNLGGETKHVLTPRAERSWLPGKAEPLESIATLEFEPRGWWDSAYGKKDKSTVSYLRLRLGKYEEEQRCHCAK